jgi:23S rRNA pseudouridine1911/1915/1917 synthase
VYIRDWLKKERTPLSAPRLLLHAATLGFVHPITGREVRLTSPLPADFESELAALRSAAGGAKQRSR